MWHLHLTLTRNQHLFLLCNVPSVVFQSDRRWLICRESSWEQRHWNFPLTDLPGYRLRPFPVAVATHFLIRTIPFLRSWAWEVKKSAGSDWDFKGASNLSIHILLDPSWVQLRQQTEHSSRQVRNRITAGTLGGWLPLNSHHGAFSWGETLI